MSLLPCPFCGGEPRSAEKPRVRIKAVSVPFWTNVDNGFWINGVWVEPSKDHDSAAKAWNGRREE